MTFNIQVPTEIVRNKNITALEFVLLAKIIQAYYLSGKKDEFELLHKNLIFLLNIGDNNTFKKAYNNLVQQGYLIDEIDKLPRKGGIKVKVNLDIIPELNKNTTFTQVIKDILDKSVIDVVGYIGIRLIYYYQSYINNKVLNKGHCYASEDTITDHLGISRKTVIEYNKKLKQYKFVKIECHDLNDTGAYIRKGESEMLVFTKYNNHYFVQEDKIKKYVSKRCGLLA